MLPLHGPRRPARHPVLPEADCGCLPRGDGQSTGPVRLRHPRTRARAVNPRPAPPSDLAARWLSKFFTHHLVGERAASPKTVASYRDAMKLLLIWFRDAQGIPPQKLRLSDIDRHRVLQFLDWLQTQRGCSAATRNQRLAVIKSFCRYTAVEQPEHLDQVTGVLAIRQKKTPAPQLDHLTGDEVKALLIEPGTTSTRAVLRHGPARLGLRHRRPRPGTLRPRRRRDPPRQPDDGGDPREGFQDRDGSSTRLHNVYTGTGKEIVS